MDSGADHGTAAAEGAKGRDDDLAGWGEDDRCVQLLGDLIRGTGPLGTQRTRELALLLTPRVIAKTRRP